MPFFTAEKLPAPFDAAAAAHGLERWRDAARDSGDENSINWMIQFSESNEGKTFIESICGNSPYLGQILTRETAWVQQFVTIGPDAAFAAAAPLLDAIAGKVWRLGDAPGQGAAMKVVHQLLAGVHIAAAAEAMALAIRSGLDPRVVYDVVTSAAGNSWMFGNRMAHVLAGDDTPLSAGDIFVKDLALVEGMAREAALPVPLAAQALQMFVAQRGIGQGGRDDAFVIRVWQAFAGFALPGEAPANEP